MGIIFVLGLYLFVVVLNVRSTESSGALQLTHLNPFSGARLITEVEGVSRLDGIDLMARITPGIHELGPAWGAAWKNTYWLVGRFWDPEGFDESRLAMTDTAKGFLMYRYWGWSTTDYLSCRLTDMYGNFTFFGLPALALIYAGLFKCGISMLSAPRFRCGIIVGMFIITNIVMFEGSADAMLFGWTRKIPVFLLFIIISPFVIKKKNMLIQKYEN